MRINAGGTALMTMFNGLGGCPLLEISGTGVPYANTCLAHDPSQATLGSGAFGQWLLLEIVHSAPTLTVTFSITGPGIDRDIVLSPYSGPGSAIPVYLGLSGDAFWDDVRAGYGEVPAPVPLPGVVGLLIPAFGFIGRFGRRRAH